jgi:uncharacterized protein (TIGR02271 family)
MEGCVVTPPTWLERRERDSFMTTGNYPPGGTWEIDNGWDVITADGDKLGDVEEVHPHYLVVGKGLIFHSERYVPVSTITAVEDNKVHLAVTKDEVERQGWDTIPDVAETTTTTGMTDTTLRTDRTLRDTDEVDVPVVEEQLDIDKRNVERGSVRVHKDVVEDEVPVNVPVREEHIRVERQAATGDRAADIGDHTFEEEDIEIPLRGEEVNVNKRPVVTEHVRIGKDVEERDETVTGRVRREDVHIEGEDTLDRGDRP